VCNENSIQNSTTRFSHVTSYVGTEIEVECFAGHYLQQGVFALRATCTDNAFWVSATNLVLDNMVSCKREYGYLPVIVACFHLARILFTENQHVPFWLPPKSYRNACMLVCQECPPMIA